MKKLRSFFGKHGAIALVILIHFWGIVGLLSPLKEWFNEATPLTLLFTFILVAQSYRPERKVPWLVITAIFFLGIVAETIGTHTGMLFGAYGYGSTLGWAVMGTPLVIGLNWIVLSLGALHWSRKMTSSKVAQVILGAVLMTLLDVLIEPVAIEYGYWIWDAGSPPLHNYIGWLGIGALAQIILVATKTKTTSFAGSVFVVLAFFFGILTLALL